MKRIGKKRLAIDIPEHVHKLLFEMAKKYNINVTGYVMIVLLERLKQESDWDQKKYV